jgi:hypothetical protein
VSTRTAGARSPVPLVAVTAVLTTVVVTWYVADLLYDIGLPRCASGRRVSSCGGDHGWHGASLVATSLLGPLAPMVLAGVYLAGSSRAVRRVKPARREQHRRRLRRHSALALLVVVTVTVPVTMLVRSVLPP